MAGENNLSAYLDTDIKEMMEGSKTLSDRENLIVYVDKASKTELPYMARIKDGEITDKYELTADPSTADPKVLELMLSQAKESYPAKSYGLVLWGHANGWLIMNDSIRYEAASRSYGGDTGNNTSGSSGSQWMNIPSMAKAIVKAMNGTQLDYIFADCCNLGGSIEVAYELKDVTKYLIGSPAEIPDNGANYNSIMKGLFSTSDSFYQEARNVVALVPNVNAGKARMALLRFGRLFHRVLCVGRRRLLGLHRRVDRLRNVRIVVAANRIQGAVKGVA
jgi:hypothetical protein